MRFASDRIEREWTSGLVHPLLRSLIQDAILYASSRWQWDLFVTCILRTREEDKELEGSGIHCEGRAIDIRTKDIDRDAVQDLTDYLNDTWAYDPKRPRLVVAISKPHGSGPHLHIQVHPNTKRRF